MRLSRVADGRTPFITNIPVYKATNAIDNGAALTATANTANNKGATVNAITTTGANASFIGVNQVGSARAAVSKENVATQNPSSKTFNIGSDGLADATTAGAGTAGGQNYLPVCINIGAMYYAQYSTTAAAATATDPLNNGISVSVGTVVTVASTSTDLAGGFLFSTPVDGSGGVTPTFSGSLRYIGTTVAAASFGLATAMNVSTDSVLIWASAPLQKQTCMSSGGDFLRGQGAATASGKVAQKCLINDNYGVGDNFPHHPLRKWADDGLDALTAVRIYSEVSFTDPFWVNG